MNWSDYYLFSQQRRLKDIHERSGIWLNKVVKKKRVNKLFDVPGLSTYSLELALLFPELKVHLLDKNKHALMVQEYVVSGDESIINELPTPFSRTAKSLRMFYDRLIDESLIERFSFYHDDLINGLDCFSKDEFDLSTINYVFQYLPINEVITVLSNLGRVTSDYLLITKIGTDFFDEKGRKVIIDSEYVNGCKKYYTISRSNLSSILGMKAKFKMIDCSRNHFASNCFNINVIAKS